MTHVAWFLVVLGIWMFSFALAFKLMDKDDED